MIVAKKSSGAIAFGPLDEEPRLSHLLECRGCQNGNSLDDNRRVRGHENLNRIGNDPSGAAIISSDSLAAWPTTDIAQEINQAVEIVTINNGWSSPIVDSAQPGIGRD